MSRVGVAAGAAGGAARRTSPPPRTCAASADACRPARPRPRSSSGARSAHHPASAKALTGVAVVARAGSPAAARAPRAPAWRPSRARRCAAAQQVAGCRRPSACGAPRPFTRSILPSVEPAGTLTLTVCRRAWQLDLRAHRRLGEGDRDVDHEVVAAAGEERAGVTWVTTKRSPGSPPRGAASPLPFTLMRVPSRRPQGSAPGRSWSSARGPSRGRWGRGSRSPCRRRRSGAGLAEREEPLALGYHAAALAVRADRRRGPRRRARAVTVGQVLALSTGTHRDAAQRVRERQLDLASTSLPRCCAARPAAPPPRLNRPPNRSPRSKLARHRRVEALAPPGRARPGRKVWPKVSYCLRFSGSEACRGPRRSA